MFFIVPCRAFFYRTLEQEIWRLHEGGFSRLSTCWSKLYIVEWEIGIL